MSWPSAATLLESQLHWMTRRLRKLQNQEVIAGWVEAMDRVLKIYNCYLKSRALSSPPPKWTKFSISEGSYVMVNPVKDTNSPENLKTTKVKKTKVKRSIADQTTRPTKMPKSSMASIPEEIWAAKSFIEKDSKGKNDIDKSEEVVREVWREALLELWKKHRYKGCKYHGGRNIAEWHPEEELFRDIARKLNRDYETEMTDKLKQFLKTYY